MCWREWGDYVKPGRTHVVIHQAGFMEYKVPEKYYLNQIMEDREVQTVFPEEENLHLVFKEQSWVTRWAEIWADVSISGRA